MATDRIHHGVFFICDTCDDTLETGEHDFSEALVALRDAGWTARREHNEWVHECPGCQKEMFE